MKRRLLNILTVLSLLLCVAVVVLWVRSVGHRTNTYWISPNFTVQLSEVDGVVGVLLTRDSGLRPPVGGTNRLFGWFTYRGPLPPGRDRASLSSPSFNRWGFGFHLAKTVGNPPSGYWRIGGRRLWIVWVPYWLPLVLTAILPAIRVATVVRRRQRVRCGHCPACGYDLRATPDRCPECGTMPDNPPAP